MNSAKVSGRIRRRAIIINTGGDHPKNAEKGRRVPLFRILKPGDQVCRGDEYNSVCFQKWMPVEATIGTWVVKSTTGYYRRPL
jgi:hypothetical protein